MSGYLLLTSVQKSNDRSIWLLPAMSGYLLLTFSPRDKQLLLWLLPAMSGYLLLTAYGEFLQANPVVIARYVGLSSSNLGTAKVIANTVIVIARYVGLSSSNPVLWRPHKYWAPEQICVGKIFYPLFSAIYTYNSTTNPVKSICGAKFN